MRPHRPGRYRFGWPAALFAGGYLVAVVVSGVIAVVRGDGEVVWWLVVRRWRPLEPGWYALVLVLAGGVQGWALWQILRGRVVGQDTAPDRHVRRLRRVLYAYLAVQLIFYVLFLLPSPWWVDVARDIGRLALVVLFHRVLDGTPRALRFIAFAAGTLGVVGSIGEEVFDELDIRAVEQIFDLVGLDGLLWSLWMALILVAQARDGRWGRGAVWSGAASVVLASLVMPLALGGFDSFSAPAFTVILGVSGARAILMLVWLARSAHDLAGAVPRRERPVPARVPLGRWPLPVAAVVLPLLPALAHLAHGLPFWIGPRGAVESAFRTRFTGSGLLLWLSFDLLVGVGGLAVLVLVAVVRRTRRLVRATACSLVIAAAVGAVTAVTTRAAPDHTAAESLGGDMVFDYEGAQIYPDWMFAPDVETGEIFFGISPLWHSAAFTVSAIILMSLYGRRPARRSPYRVAVAVAVSVVALSLLPVADHARGPFTSRSDCERARSTAGEYGQHVESRPMTGETAFVCEARGSDGPPFGQGTPDLALVAYGHRLCGVYTRNDPREIARVREASGVDVRGLTYPLDEICPRAAAIVKARIDAEDREIAEREAEEQRKCDAAPRHRPLIRPESASVRREPLWTDHGVLEAYEEDGYNDPFEDGLYELLEKNGLVAALPGHLMISIYADPRVCVTTETYRRRPPVETKGWHHVVEVGYQSPTGEIKLRDAMGGPELPDLAVRGKGHYRIRVHYAWLPWKGEKRAGQRLLIMAYPGRGDEVVVHRERTDP
ncbi:hypothetical protein [Streptosporangium minutum]|uniref:Uncharacterized protein n=1 Tax=Streptosporangium minutum TaxID=569862 RepID=A0A243RIP2_9ACTN|nr:hypothetical protein [Streptosporangium minutum]OUC94692.1 hypothetical protein CA984_21550 [Streptosporangium minutum]